MTAPIPVRELSVLLRPLAEALVDAPLLAAYLQFIGHRVDGARAEQIRTAVAPQTAAVADAFDGAATNEFDADSAATVARASNDLLDALARQVALAEGSDPAPVYDDLLNAALRYYLGRRVPFVVAALEALGVLVEPNAPTTAGAPRPIDSGKVEFHWGRLADFLRDTPRWAAEVYGWGVAGSGAFDHMPAMARIAKLVETLQIATTHVRSLTEAEALALLGPQSVAGQIRVDLPLFQTQFVDVDLTGEPQFAAELGVSVLPFITGFALSPLLIGTATTAKSLSGGVEVAAAVEAETPLDARPLLAITPAGMQTLLLDATGQLSPADVPFRVDGTLTYRRDDGPLWTVGASAGTHVLATGTRFAVSLRAPTEIVVSVGVLGLTIVAALDDDDLLRSLLDTPVRLPLGDIAFGYSTRSGGFVDATLPDTATLARSFPLNVAAGPVLITRADIVLRFAAPADGGVRLTAAAGVAVAVRLGPVRVALDTPGIAATLDLSGSADGPFDYAFVPPTGAAIEVAAGPVVGGGAVGYDAATGRYSGAVALRFLQTDVRAVAVLDTRLPDGERGFSLLVLLAARFPGIQLGFGVQLTGVGGLLAINRRIDVDALAERYASGAAARLLGSTDPLLNLPAMLADLAAVFPPSDGVYVVGPTLQLQWAKLVTVDAGVFLEFPGPTRVVVLGTARASVTNPLAAGPLLRLRCDFVGVLDLVQRTFACDAVLLESRLFEEFPVTGGLMIRAGWGDDPYVLFSAGGFHPDFAPGGLVVPRTLTRLTLSSGTGDDALRLRMEGYFAVTPNTVQFGASAEVVARLSSSVQVRGFLTFDALVRLEPFQFAIAFSAGMRVQWRGRTFAGITVHGTLTGPGPVRFTGRACIELLFFDVCAGKTFTLGSDAPPAVVATAVALEVLVAELRDPANLRAAGEERTVALRPLPTAPRPVLPPNGIVWEQTRAPLGLLLERIESAPLRRVETIEATGADVSGTERDWFAPGSFAELTDAEALTRRSFERLPSGVRLATGPDDVSDGVPHAVTVQEFHLPAPTPTRLQPLDAPQWLQEAAQVREGRSDGPRRAPQIGLRPEAWQVLDRTGAVLTSAVAESQAHQLARFEGAAVAVSGGDVFAFTDF